jgi:putative transposase
MARPLRIEYPGAFYHVMNRGNAGEDLFKSKRDRERFLECLETAGDRFSLRIHVYCLMTNHYHLLLETLDANLSRAVQWINVSFAAYFNRKRHRRGHLFQGRFKSILVEAEEYLKELSRYIHLNPVRAGIVEKSEAYPWSSYGAYIGKTKRPEWLETQWLLSQFAQKDREAKQRYRGFVEMVDPATLENPEKALTSGVILGTGGFVKWVKETFVDPREDHKEIPQLTDLKRSIPVETIIDTVGAEFGCTRAEILEKGRKGNLARDTAVYLARDLTKESAQILGAYFGGISGAGITMRYKHMSQEAAQSRRLTAMLKKLRGLIVNI